MCIFVDLAKAFDTVFYTEMLSCWQNLGFNIIKSIFWIGAIVCNIQEVTYGVPQGIVLEPLFFKILVNDMFQINITGNIASFSAVPHVQ